MDKRAAIAVLLALLLAAPAAPQRTDLDRIRTDITRLRKRLEDVRLRTQSAERELEEVDVELGLRTSELELATSEEVRRDAEQRVIEGEIAALIPRIAQQKDELRRRLVALYRLGGLSYLRVLLSLDGGTEAARQLIESTFASDIRDINAQDLLFHDYKTALQELAQGSGLPLPEYSVVDEVGPDHDKMFVVEVKVGSLIARGEGTSKKEAQQQAAKHALQLSSRA